MHIDLLDKLLPQSPADRPDCCFSIDLIRRAMVWLNLPDEVQSAMLLAGEQLMQDPPRLELWQRLHQRWIASGPQHIEEATRWPAFKDANGAAFYALLCLSGVAQGRASLEHRGVPADLVAASFHDVLRKMQLCYQTNGCWGIEKPRWLGRHLHGRLLELGRLQYERGVASDKLRDCNDPDLPQVLARHDLTPDTPVWWIHIPAGVTLAPTDCEASIEMARQLLPRYFPDHRARCLACRTWMLDPQLRDYLPPQSNILHFAARFRLIHQWPDESDDMGQFLRKPAPGGRLTILQQADLQHRAGGKRWGIGMGLADMTRQTKDQHEQT